MGSSVYERLNMLKNMLCRIMFDLTRFTTQILSKRTNNNDPSCDPYFPFWWISWLVQNSNKCRKRNILNGLDLIQVGMTQIIKESNKQVKRIRQTVFFNLTDC